MRSRQENLAHLRRVDQAVAPGQKFVVKDFEPEDAPGVAALYYRVYGENFPIDSVYDPDQLIAAHATRQAHYVVGRAESGDILGLYALFRNPPGAHIMEAGSWIVLPAYRNSTLAMRLAQRIHCTPPTHLGLYAIFGQSVCDHCITQKMSAKFHAHSSALELEAMPPRPEDAQGRSGGRISLLDAIILLQDAPHTVHLPTRYADVVRRLYAPLGLERTFVADAEASGVSVCTVRSMDAASLVKLTIDSLGSDIAGHIDRFAMESADRDVAQILIPLWQPGVTPAVEAARAAGFFLGGLLPFWADRDMLLLQKLRTAPDYSKIQLFSQEARDLLALIVADRQSLAV